MVRSGAYPCASAAKRLSGGCGRHAEGDPLGAVAALVADLVDERGEHAREARVVRGAVAEPPERESQRAAVGVDLDRGRVPVSRVQHAHDGELEVVHPLVCEICATSDAPYDECRHAPKAGVGRDREDDSIAHADLEFGLWKLDHDGLDSFAVSTTDDFDVRTELTQGGAVVHVSGELDLATASKLEDVVVALPSSADPVVVNLSECTFLDSAGMRVLLTAARRLADEDRDLRLVSADPRILRVLEITAIDTLIAVHPSLEAAL